MTTVLKKTVSFLLAVLTVFSLCSVCAVAEDDPYGNLYISGLLYTDVDAAAHIVRTIYIEFANQFANHNASINLQLLDESDKQVATVIPRASDAHTIDIYDMSGNLGLVVTPDIEYTLLIPQGAYYIANSTTVCNEHRMVVTGAALCGSTDIYHAVDLGISSYMTSKHEDTVVYTGQITVSAKFTDLNVGNCSAMLSKLETVDGKSVYVDVAAAAITDYKNNCATLNFGTNGVTIDRYASYKITVSYASFYADSRYTLCDTSEFLLSGKRLLKLREDYRILDLLIKWFGKDHFTVKAIVWVINALSKVKLIDSAYVKDVKKYIDAK